MIIRKIEKKDDARVAFIIRECLTEYGCAGKMDTAWGDPYLDHFSEVYVNEDNCYWVVENDQGEVIAGVGIGPLCNESKTCELQKMYCLKEYRGSGAGQMLMDKALEFARKHYKACYLETRENMERAVSFYKRNGFVHTCGTIGCTGHAGCDYHFILKFEN